MAGLVLQNVRKRFGAVDVIEDLSLDVAEGEFAVFLGPSGCGKSTLLRMIAGLEAPTSGEIHLGRRRIDTLAPGDRGVAMVFQNYALYPHMTVRQNMAFGLRNVGMKAAEVAQRVARAAEMLEIAHLLDRKPGQMSGGQRQRVAIGRAIVKQPEAFLFDEPLSNLDAALRSRTRVELARLHQQVGSTMVFVTHDQMEAMTLATRIVVMSHGRIEQVGTSMEVYRRPRTRFVAGFIGSPAMNFLPVAAIEARDGLAVVVLPDGVRVPTAVATDGLPAGALTLGVRAEHVEPSAVSLGAASPGAGSPAVVDIVERLGERTLVHARLGDGAVVVYDEEGTVEVRSGDRVALGMRADAVHLFDEAGLAHHAR